MMYTYFGERDMEKVLEKEKEMEKKGRIIANVKFLLKGKQEVHYISPNGYGIKDVGLLY